MCILHVHNNKGNTCISVNIPRNTTENTLKIIFIQSLCYFLYYIVCLQAKDRIDANLLACHATKGEKENFSGLEKISKDVVANGGLLQRHPLGF